MDDWVFEKIPQLPDPDKIESWLIAGERPGVFKIAPQPGKELQARFRPFHAIGEVTPSQYRIYHDLHAAPIPAW